MTVPFPRRRVLAATAAMCAIGGLGVAAPAGAATPKGIFLTVSGVRSTWIRGVLLDCDKVAHSTHPQATAACADLTEADGDPDRLPGAPQRCPDEYEPVTATAAGTWHGRPVDWRETYPNACELDADTGPLFRF